MIFAPHRRHLGSSGCLRFLGAIATYQIKGFSVGRWKNGVDTVIPSRGNLAKEFDFVQVAIAVAICDAIQTTGNFVLVIVHADVERVERPDHTIHSANLHG